MVAFGPDAADRYRFYVRAVHREERRDPVTIFALDKQMPHAAQIPETFLADVAHEQDIALRPNAGCIQRSDISQQHREAAGVVADPGGE